MTDRFGPWPFISCTKMTANDLRSLTEYTTLNNKNAPSLTYKFIKNFVVMSLYDVIDIKIV